MILLAPDTGVRKSGTAHISRLIDIAQIYERVATHQLQYTLQIKTTINIPLSHEYDSISAAYRIVDIIDVDNVLR